MPVPDPLHMPGLPRPARWLPALLSLCLALPAHALNPELALTQYTHRVWQAGQVEGGLPQNSVFSIAQTADGYLWLATQEGLVRFDGARFTVFNTGNTAQIRHNDVWKLVADPDGGLWIATRGGGLTHYRDGAFRSIGSGDGLASDTVHALWLDADGSLWVGTTAGLSQLKQGRLSTYTAADGLGDGTIYAIHRDAQGTLWVGTDGAGVHRLHEGRFVAPDGPPELRKATIYAIHEDRDGALWIGTGNGLFRHLDGAFRRYDTADGLSSENVRAIHEDRDGNLWIGTDGGGLNRLREGRFTAFTTAHGLASNSVGAIAGDREGNLWVGTDGGGLNRFNDNKFVTFGEAEGLSDNNARTVMEGSDGRLWIGTFGGLNVRDGSGFRTYTTADGLSSDIILSLTEGTDGSIWAGTLDGGLNRLHDGRFSHYTPADGLAGNTVLSLLEDREGDLWVGTRGSGLSRLRAGEFHTWTTEHGLPNNSVRVMLEARNGDLWLGTLGGGLSRWRDGAFDSWGTADGLSNARVFALHEDARGVLWIGTFGGGLNRFENGEFTQYTTASGLHDDAVFQILEDDDGDLWLSSNRGISRLDRQQLDDFAAGRTDRLTPVVYGQFDGMRSRECNGGHQPAGWKTRAGRLWFPTIRGVVTINPQDIQTNTRKPPVVIEQILANERPVAMPELLVLEPGSRKLEFRYTALSFTAPEKVRFRHRLEGFDQDWVAAGTQRVAHYTNLPPGNYEFRVTAMNNDGLWNETGARQAFRIEPYFYQRRAFYLVYLLAIGLVIALALRFHRRRIERLEARERELLQLMAQRQQAENALRDANRALERQLAELAETGDPAPPATTGEPLPEPIRSDAGSLDMEKLVADFNALLGTVAQRDRELHDARTELEQSSAQLERSNRVIKRYVPAQLVHQIMAGQHPVDARPERRRLTIAYAAIEGFTDAPETLDPERLAALLNEYLSEMTTIADRYDATIGHIAGDALLIFVGAPTATDDEDHAKRAVLVALEMLHRTAELRTQWEPRGLPSELQLRIGVNTGVASVGDFGSEGRKMYSAVGAEASLARQIQEHCAPGHILISASTRELVRSEIPTEERGAIDVEGRAGEGARGKPGKRCQKRKLTRR